MNQWYIIKTKPHRDESVGTLLTNGGFEIFNPKIREISYRSRIRYFITKQLFPCYLFLNAEFDNPQNIHLVKYTRGVSKILCTENKPLPVEPLIIQTIQEQCNNQGIVDRSIPLKKGDLIRVKKGMLKDLIGILEKPLPAEQRIIVLLNLANYKMQATLHWSEVERIKAA